MPVMTMTYSRVSKAPQRGFSLLELLVVLAILMIIVAVVTKSAIQLQQRNATETNKVDLTQETRQFMDQIVKDLHHAGFPGLNMFDVATSTANPNNVALGLTSVNTTAITFEGDVDGSGKVSQVSVQLNPAGGPCPCTLRRGAVDKTIGGAPVYYTEVDNVMNLDIFTAYQFDGTKINLATSSCATAATCKALNIKTIGLKVNLRSNSLDPIDQAYSNITMQTEAKINN
ncbi:MAG: hypothetical protein DMG72_06420 [Acidobacteria bacterium]|nr:MAG: hypothetical protein DMG72_06420 [Acidobacteriota bacterium]